MNYSTPSQQNVNEWITRVDYRINDKNNIYGRLYRNINQSPAEMVANNIFSNQRGVTGTADNGTIAETYTPLPNLVIDTKFTVNRFGGDRATSFQGSIRTLGVDINPSSNEVNVAINGTSDKISPTNRPAIFARTNFEA